MPIRTSPERTPAAAPDRSEHNPRKVRSNKSRTSRDAKETEEVSAAAKLNPAIRRGVIAVLLFGAAILATLSFFNLAGIVGVFVDRFLSLLFGGARYVVPVLLIIWAVIIEKEEKLSDKPHHIIGFILFLLGVNGLAGITVPASQMMDQAMQGYRGGLVGMILGYPLLAYTGVWAAVPILIIITLISLMLITNISVSQALAFLKRMGAAVWNIFGSAAMATRVIGASAPEEEEEFVQEDPTVRARHIEPAVAAKEDDETEEDEEADDEPVEPSENPKELENALQPPLKLPSKKKTFKPLPAFELLQANKSKAAAGDTKASGQVIVDTLKQFGIGCELAEVRTGPTVTQYSIHPDRGVKISKITALSNDLALALAAHPIRIEAPIPGKPYVGIEVPNERVALVTLRELFESEDFQRRSNNMCLALGKDVSGKTWVTDLTRMPHLLVAGATGSGKTVCLNTLIMSLLYQNTDETLRFIMIDPKRVELTLYNGLPHLLTPVITDAPRAVNALKWAISEMERRYELLSAVGSRDIISYNKKAPEKLPYIVIIVDEVADLMLTSGQEIEGGIIRLAQMARAIGIHLIVATQRPSVDVITGLMKANIPARIAFSVASITDSRTILDCAGAEKLLGRGDMLLSTAELAKPKRVQGAYISEEELKRVVDYWKSDTAPEYNPLVTEKPVSGSASIFGGKDEERDSMYEEAKQVVLESGKASTSFLQRRLKLGYGRAARIIDELEKDGIVGPADGAKPREILLHGGVRGGTMQSDAKELEPNADMLDAFDDVPSEAEEEIDSEDEWQDPV